MSATTSRKRLQINEHGGPELRIDGSSEFPSEEPVLSAVPDHGGHFAAGYAWIGGDNGCFGHIEMRHFLAFADAIRKKK